MIKQVQAIIQEKPTRQEQLGCILATGFLKTRMQEDPEVQK